MIKTIFTLLLALSYFTVSLYSNDNQNDNPLQPLQYFYQHNGKVIPLKLKDIPFDLNTEIQRIRKKLAEKKQQKIKKRLAYYFREDRIRISIRYQITILRDNKACFGSPKIEGCTYKSMKDYNRSFPVEKWEQTILNSLDKKSQIQIKNSNGSLVKVKIITPQITIDKIHVNVFIDGKWELMRDENGEYVINNESKLKRKYIPVSEKHLKQAKKLLEKSIFKERGDQLIVKCIQFDRKKEHQMEDERVRSEIRNRSFVLFGLKTIFSHTIFNYQPIFNLIILSR